ncbi:MAG: hypothetical protein A2W61_02385 [Deltaproteobacteria bacterium RIFCSPLOWO2_01_44_7]|nr:MAG: hypothetical protein A2712_03620 [Deltaproteobacteria bacterium RIFCSPHIGHO2_01_FULL_43_49]OGQ16281.1 MAG: hypothetical protein A3D22_01590 [Deltaproteobacteria bacterium RIFCSPHIGHO2_02_FULL_44_53]OGQ29241.1 MAG: hypothetical protein A3D98_05375 [Deltaproteobacteria bacterium RIFCSPHIGHO2_12_FULL_44_21]OGQ32798.1 MAG: hypothetical protein A2979_09520 [Deltaproteobacteria bacterium RIFCSPLOWO2_01_FULL_45_74]OGQ38382.1 MAG: hypothetical protein A2W61_02385 [Deltaproteobacteria bacterium 
MNAHFTNTDGGKQTEGDMEALAVQDVKKGMKPEQLLAKIELKKDGNFDLVVRDAEGNLKHVIASNTDPGAKQLHKMYKGNKSGIAITIGQHSYKLLAMDDGLA